MDQNKEILDIIQQRMKIGRERYGHGLRINDDTRQWGTKEDSWEEMALEEMLDGMIYISASILRLRNKRNNNTNVSHETDESVCNSKLMDKLSKQR